MPRRTYTLPSSDNLEIFVEPPTQTGMSEHPAGAMYPPLVVGAPSGMYEVVTVTISHENGGEYPDNLFGTVLQPMRQLNLPGSSSSGSSSSSTASMAFAVFQDLRINMPGKYYFTVRGGFFDTQTQTQVTTSEISSQFVEVQYYGVARERARECSPLHYLDFPSSFVLLYYLLVIPCFSSTAKKNAQMAETSSLAGFLAADQQFVLHVLANSGDFGAVPQQ
ncbi:hypothetical protein F5Y16DRAFT_402819 [Xylariaceae sp. FL0255]|nr:hypothetical protein F5Y16DRAFT_402819 [Xylariaceae sp. FL0255]